MGERWERVGDGERHWKAAKARNTGVVSDSVELKADSDVDFLSPLTC